MQNLLPAETSLRGHELGDLGKPLSQRASRLLFGGRVFEKPLLFPPDAHHCECRQNSQRDFGEAMPRSNPWRLCARNHHDDRQRDAGVAIADLFQAKHKRYQPEKKHRQREHEEVRAEVGRFHCSDRCTQRARDDPLDRQWHRRAQR